MPLKKNFLHKDLNINDISRTKFFTGILIGLFYSFAFYSFLYLIREIFRFFSVTENYDLWVLTDSEVNFYNLIFAYISVILGQSVAFSFWVDQPKRNLGLANYRKATILNDLRVLIWYFLSWVFKLALLYATFFGLAFAGGFYVFSFYPDYNFVFILIIIVLFLQSWTSIILTYKKKSLKWMLVSGVLLTISAFGISKINLIDYQALNHKILKKNIHYSYNLDLPETNSFETNYRRSLTNSIYLVEPKNAQDHSEPSIVIDNKRIELEKLSAKIEEWRSNTNEYERDRMVYRFYIHSPIKMGFVHKVRNELTRSGVSKIAYAVVPMNTLYKKRFDQNFSFPMILPRSIIEGLDPFPIYPDITDFPNIINITQSESGCTINDTLVNSNRIKNTIKQLIEQNSDYLIKLQVDDNVAFSDYFKILSFTREAVDDLRNAYSEEKYSKQFDELSSKEWQEVSTKFPFRIRETTVDLKQ